MALCPFPARRAILFKFTKISSHPSNRAFYIHTYTYTHNGTTATTFVFLSCAKKNTLFHEATSRVSSRSQTQKPASSFSLKYLDSCAHDARSCINDNLALLTNQYTILITIFENSLSLFLPCTPKSTVHTDLRTHLPQKYTHTQSLYTSLLEEQRAAARDYRPVGNPSARIHTHTHILRPLNIYVVHARASPTVYHTYTYTHA